MRTRFTVVVVVVASLLGCTTAFAQDCEDFEGRIFDDTALQRAGTRPEFQALVGVAFRRGCAGLPQDYAAARSWLTRAAAAGVAGAQSRLGIMARNGEGIPSDPVQAVWWWRLAAEQGHADSQARLAASYTLGEGVRQDFVLAHYWANQSAAQGDADGRQIFEIVQAQMTAAQVAEAQRLLRERQGEQ